VTRRIPFSWYGSEYDGSYDDADHSGGHYAAHVDGLCDCDEIKVPNSALVDDLSAGGVERV